MREMSKSVQIFNPIFLNTKSSADIVTKLHFLADKLGVFNYSHFSDTFIARLKKEMWGVVKEAKRDHDLERIP